MSAMTVDCAAVDFDLSTDQQALRDAAATLLDRMAGHDALRARVGAGAVVGTLAAGTGEAPSDGAARTGRRADAPAGYDAGVWSAMADQGWLAIEVPADEGGLGLGMVELAVLCEEIGRRLVAAPFLPSVVALGALCSPEARGDAGTKEWREALSEGAAVGCVVLRPGRRRSRSPRQVRAATSASAGARRPPPTPPRPTWRWSSTGGGVYAVDLRTEGRPAARAGHGPHARAGHPRIRRHAGPPPGRRRRGASCWWTGPPRSPAPRCSVRPTACCP